MCVWMCVCVCVQYAQLNIYACKNIHTDVRLNKMFILFIYYTDANIEIRKNVYTCTVDIDRFIFEISLQKYIMRKYLWSRKWNMARKSELYAAQTF